MHPVDVKNLETLLAEMAECYAKPLPTPVVLKHWYDALRHFSFFDIERELILWRDSCNKPPMISDIRASLLQKRKNVIAQPFASQPAISRGDSDEIEKDLRQRGLWKNDNESSEQWIARMRRECKVGVKKMAGQSLTLEREPGCDDE